MRYLLVLLLFVGCASLRQSTEEKLDPRDEQMLAVLERLNQQEREIRQLQAEVDALRHAAKELSKEVAVEVPKKEPAKPPTLYQQAVQKFEGGQFREAIALARNLLLHTPDDVDADKAQWILMESHFQLAEYELAVVDSNVLENKYPQSPKVAEALYRRGIALSNMGQKQMAKDTLRSLVRKFPKTLVSQLALEKMLEKDSKSAPPLLKP